MTAVSDFLVRIPQACSELHPDLERTMLASAWGVPAIEKRAPETLDYAEVCPGCGWWVWRGQSDVAQAMQERSWEALDPPHVEAPRLAADSLLLALSRVLDVALALDSVRMRKVRSDARMMSQAAQDLGRDPDAFLAVFWAVLGERRKGSAVSLPTLVARLVPHDQTLVAAVERREVSRVSKQRRNSARKARRVAAT